MTDAAKMADWWVRVITGRQIGDEQADLDFARGTDRCLDELAPHALPTRPSSVPPTGVLEQLARDGGKGGPWLPDFLQWRSALEAVEQRNMGAIEAIFGAAEAAGRRGDATLVRRLLVAAFELYGYKGEPPVGREERAKIAAALTRKLDVLGLKARTVAWQAPVAAESRSVGMGGQRESRAW